MLRLWIPAILSLCQAVAGLRFMMRQAVFRAEIAGNDDSWSSWIMIGHPF
jgi:hypothetical protein